ncbi:hypothetical protein BV20DRAFT_953067 [Pilatotrama ljubarskyi]|nr:hypothetical protein BV20DRAFT_953067 [Pilatotrama ljubarskyi]
MSAQHNTAFAQDGLTIMFEHCTAQLYNSETLLGSAPPPAPSSLPSTPADQLSTCPLDDASEDSWNLIPYDVPWGPEYYHYKAGTLPGPDGACIFLRSPTPLKNRRTQKACNKCRQRKAKCSGTHPTCSRCLARGYICEYAEEEKRPAHNAVRHRNFHQQRELSEEPSDDADCSSVGDDYSSPGDSVQPFAPRPLKLEDPEFSTPDLLYPDSASISDSASSSAEYSSPWDDARYTSGARYAYDSSSESFGEGNMGDYYDSPSYTIDTHMQAYASQHMSAPVYFEQEASQHAAAVHAPRPVRCTGSPSFLAPEEQPSNFSSSCEAQMLQHDDMLMSLSTPAEATPQIAIPQLPPMSAGDLTAVHGVPVMEYAHPQAMYYCPAPMPLYPYLQYQYTLSGYTPVVQENAEPTMLYTMMAARTAS